MKSAYLLVIEDDAVYASLVERMLGESRDVRFEVHITDSLITGLWRLMAVGKV